jgi:hypothetical protein
MMLRVQTGKSLYQRPAVIAKPSAVVKCPFCIKPDVHLVWD